MTSKVEYIQRYLSTSVNDKKKRKKRRTDPTQHKNLHLPIVREETVPESTLSSSEYVEQSWPNANQDAEEEEDDGPLIVAENGETLQKQELIEAIAKSRDTPKAHTLPTDDLSPPRKSRAASNRSQAKVLSSDPAPHTNARKSPRNGSPDKSEAASSPPRRPRAGLHTKESFQAEQAQLEKSTKWNADDKAMGAHAKTVFRDRRGRKLDMLQELQRQQEAEEGRHARQIRQEYEWGTGKVQKEHHQNQKKVMEKIKSAPFARFADDVELEKTRKQRVRDFDPLHSEHFHQKGASKKKKRRKGSGREYIGPPAPTNRFGILPGYRWDGVVRGTGWEEKILLHKNAKSANKADEYAYATADM